MSGQKPSVGRVVHYVSHGTPRRADGSQAFTSQCRAAIITEVADPNFGEGETAVGLAVLNPTGMFFHSMADGGCEFHDGSETPGDPSCPNQPHAEMPFRYCPQAGCGWREAAHQGGTWHWPERS